MACKPPLFHCILPPFSCPPFYHNIHITAKEGYNHNNPAGQIRLRIHSAACPVQFHTSKRRHDNSHAPKNISRSHSTIQLLADQSSCCAKGYLFQLSPSPGRNSNSRRLNMLLSYFRPILPLSTGIVPAQRQPLRIVCDNITPAHNNIAAADLTFSPPPAAYGIYSDSGQGLWHAVFCDKLQYQNR